MTLTPQLFKKALAALGHQWATGQPNLIGIRTTLAVPNVFNDLFAVVFTQPPMPAGLSLLQQQGFLNTFNFTGSNGQPLTEDGQPGKQTSYALAQLAASVGVERLQTWPFTSLPGLFYLQNPIAGGCAVLKVGQYPNAYILGNHQGKLDHPALVQQGGEVTIYRDADRDSRAEETGPQQTGYFGINIHRSNKEGATPVIANWSAGCQVFQRRTHHAQLLAICGQYRASSRNRFTYTLIHEADLV